MFMLSCMNCMCFEWVDAEANIRRAYCIWERKKNILLLLLLVINWHVKFGVDKCKVIYIYSRGNKSDNTDEWVGSEIPSVLRMGKRIFL